MNGGGGFFPISTHAAYKSEYNNIQSYSGNLTVSVSSRKNSRIGLQISHIAKKVYISSNYWHFGAIGNVFRKTIPRTTQRTKQASNIWVPYTPSWYFGRLGPGVCVKINAAPYYPDTYPEIRQGRSSSSLKNRAPPVVNSTPWQNAFPTIRGILPYRPIVRRGGF